MGYSGGTLDNPTYQRIGDHSEAIQIEFNPNRISFRQLVNIFWRNHDPTRKAWRRQYLSVAFYHDENQKQIIEETMAAEEEKRRKTIKTEIQPMVKFYRAEDYHQKYYLRQNRQLVGEYKAIYPDSHPFTDSTATARVNGYLGGNGSAEQLAADLPSLGLSQIGQMRLKEQVEFRLN